MVYWLFVRSLAGGGSPCVYLLPQISVAYRQFHDSIDAFLPYNIQNLYEVKTFLRQSGDAASHPEKTKTQERANIN